MPLDITSSDTPVIDVTIFPPPIVGVVVNDPIHLDIIGLPGSQGPQGDPGPTGPQGPQGLPGEDGSTGSYTHIQNTASSVWTIVHNLGFVPNVLVVDSSGREVIGDVTVIDLNTITVTFSAAFGGTAYLS